jgi:hypothetical protein
MKHSSFKTSEDLEGTVKTVGGDMPIFSIYFLGFSHSMQTWAYVLHCLACWRGVDASWRRIEVSLLVGCWNLVWSKSVKKFPIFPQQDSNLFPTQQVARTVKYLNDRQRQTVLILQHVRAVRDLLPEGAFVHRHSNLLPNDLARQYCKYHHTSVPIEADCSLPLSVAPLLWDSSMK